MSLKPFESKSLYDFFRTGAFSDGTYFVLDFLGGVPPISAVVYCDRLGAMIAIGTRYTSPATFLNVTLQFDPLGLDNTAPLSLYRDTSADNEATRLAVGEWDQDANSQNLWGGTSAGEIWPISQTTYLMPDYGSSYFPFDWDASHVSEATIGGWTDGIPGDVANGHFVFFETWGYALRACARVRHTDNQLYRGLALIDLSDGKATLLDVPTVFDNVPRALFEAPPYNGDEFQLGDIQFVRDDDSLPAAPKGRIFLTSYDYLGDGPAIPSNDHRYLKVIEWNPLGVAPAPGTPNRVHLREILMTQLHFVQKDEFETEGGVVNSQGGYPDPGGTGFLNGRKILYHPPSRTLLTYTDWGGDGDSCRGSTRHTMTPVLDQIEPPTPQSEVETNKTITFKARGMGDLGDPLAGVEVDWALARRSTLDEILDTSGAPVSNIVAHPPIDDDTLVVKYNGTPLTEGVDYSVVEATGTITWMGSHSPPAASGYTASYRHSTVSATPAHGTLLQDTSDTDVDGVAETRVQYADDDDLEHARDRLTVTMSDD